MRHIGREDIAHYEGELVMRIARGMVSRGKSYEDASDRTRRRLVEGAIAAACVVLNDPVARRRILESFRTRSDEDDRAIETDPRGDAR